MEIKRSWKYGRLILNGIIAGAQRLPEGIAKDRAELATLTDWVNSAEDGAKLGQVYMALRMAVSWASDYQHELAHAGIDPDTDLNTRVSVNTLTNYKARAIEWMADVNGPDHQLSHGAKGYMAEQIFRTRYDNF